MLGMDDATRCRQQLSSFRIRELKDVLSRLGLPKQGKKQILMEKIMGVLNPPERTVVALKSLARGVNKNTPSREECINVIDDIYRKLRGSGALDLASAGKKDVGAASSSLARSEEHDEAVGWGETKTRCPCGSTRDMGTMIQCDDSKCGVWQHLKCVVIPEKPDEKSEPDVPNSFYCELCRISRCDPFCTTVSSPLSGTKLIMSEIKNEGQNPMQNIEKTFYLSSSDRDLIQRAHHDLQVWCVLLNDKVAYRMHWSQYPDLRINGVAVRVTNRPGQQLLGANGRDDGPGITTYTREGINRISFAAFDARPFCIGVRIIRRNTPAQILDMIPDVDKGEDFEDAIGRIRRAFNGGGLGNLDDGDDSDLEVVTDSITVTVRCPMSGSRIKVAGRFKPCLHLGCFDLNTFVEMNQRARKWQCPICQNNYSLENLIIDPFLNRVTDSLKGYPEDVTEIDLKSDGMWRPKVEGEKSRDPWRGADGVIIASNGPAKDQKQDLPLVLVKLEEGISLERGSGSLLRGTKRPHENQWPNAKRANGWTSVNTAGPSARPKPTVLSRSSSATDSNGDDGERSVNQQHSGKDENGICLDDTENTFTSKGTNIGNGWAKSNATQSHQQPSADVIVLSDTDEEDGELLLVGSSAASVYAPSETFGRPMSRNSPQNDVRENPDDDLYRRSIAPPFPLVNSVGSTRGLTTSFENNNIKTSHGGGNLGLPLDAMWNPSIRAQSFNYYAPSTVHLGSAPAQQNPPIRPTAVQAIASTGFGFTSSQQSRDTLARSTGWKFGRSPTGSQSNSDCNGVSNDGGLVVTSRDSPLRLFLPHQPARAQMQPSLREPQEEVDNSWFSLSIPGHETVANPVPLRRDKQRSGRSFFDSLAESASEGLLGMSARSSQADSRLKNQGSSGHGSPVGSPSPVPISPPYGRVPTSHTSPNRTAHQSPAMTNRHHHFRTNYFRVDSDSE